MKYVEYYIFFEKSNRPEVVRFEHVLQMLDELGRLIADRGPIEWMQRKFK